MTPELYHDTPDLSTPGVKSIEERSPGYYAIIPANVRYDTSIPANAKLLYGEISALLNVEGFCFASNQYFADLYSVTIKSISRLISMLEQAGYIRCQIEKDKSGKVACRKIYLQSPGEPQNPVDKNVHTPGQNCGGGIDKNVQYTNTSITNIRKENKKEKNSFDPKPVFMEWIDKELPHLTAPHGEILGAREKNMLYISLVNFSENRHAMKKPIPSKAAVTAILNRLVKFTKDTPNRVAAMIDILELATSSNWQTVYAPKESVSSAPQKPQGGSVMIEI